MKDKVSLLLLILLFFSVSMTVSAGDREFPNPFEYSVFTETTAFQDMGGVIDQLLIDESVAVQVESINDDYHLDITPVIWTGSLGAYINSGQTKWFMHPAVLGIA